MATVDLKDASWQKFLIDSTDNLDSLNGHIQAVMASILLMHAHTPTKWVKLTAGLPAEMEIRYIDNRTWKVLIHQRDMNSPVSYVLNQSDQWKREEMIRDHIIPVTNAIMRLHALYVLSSVDLRPR